MNTTYAESTNQGLGKVQETNLFSEFTQQLQKEQIELHSIADKIEKRLHRIKNTNYPIPTDDRVMDKITPRGNDDLEFELFSSLDSLTSLRIRLNESLSKLESII